MVDMTVASGNDASVRSPISGRMFEAGQVDPEADQGLTHELVRQLKQGFKQSRIILSETQTPSFHIGQGFNGSREVRQIVQTLGRTTGADYVILGFIYDFRERSGGDFGIKTPAQIAFELNLVQVKSGRLVWQRHYKEKQKALNENIFQFKSFWRRKGRWITAMEMAASAMEEMITELAKKYH
jgi:curli biogenesis system outer membrane secretion channel CsgG